MILPLPTLHRFWSSAQLADSKNTPSDWQVLLPKTPYLLLAPPNVLSSHANCHGLPAHQFHEHFPHARRFDPALRGVLGLVRDPHGLPFHQLHGQTPHAWEFDLSLRGALFPVLRRGLNRLAARRGDLQLRRWLHC